MTSADRNRSPLSRLALGIMLLLLSAARANALDGAHIPTPSPKLANPPVLSIGTITIAPDPARAAPVSPARANPGGARRNHKLRPADLPLPTYLLHRA